MLVLYMFAFDSMTLGLHLVLYTCDLVNVINMAATFRLAYEDEDGILVTDLSLIRRRYLKSTFFVDVLSAVPFELFVIGYPASTPLLRLNRLFHAYQLGAFFGNVILVYGPVMIDTTLSIDRL